MQSISPEAETYLNAILIEPKHRHLLRLSRPPEAEAPVILEFLSHDGSRIRFFVPLLDDGVLIFEHFERKAGWLCLVEPNLHVSHLALRWPAFFFDKLLRSENLCAKNGVYAAVVYSTLYNNAVTGINPGISPEHSHALENFIFLGSRYGERMIVRDPDREAGRMSVSGSAVTVFVEGDCDDIESLASALPNGVGIIIAGPSRPHESRGLTGRVLRRIETDYSGEDILTFCDALYTGGLTSEFIVRLRLRNQRGRSLEAQIAWLENRLVIEDLVGSPAKFESYLRCFATNDSLGMVFDSLGCERSEPGDGRSPPLSTCNFVSSNVLERMGLASASPWPMLGPTRGAWMRSAAVQRVRDLNLSLSNRENERDRADAAAVESLLPTAVYLSGYRVVRSDQLRAADASRDVTKRPSICVREPKSVGDRIAFFVTFAPDGRVAPPAQFYMRRLRESGFGVLAFCVVNDCERPADDPGPEICDGLYLRANGGYDFSVWADALRRLPFADQAEMLLLANDSVLGPLGDLSSVVERCLASPADVIGLCESYQYKRHFQSFFLLFKQKALRSEAFRLFWGNVREQHSKFNIIRAYEVELVSKLEAGGLSAECLFPLAQCSPDINPSIQLWRELLEKGFPFIKTELLRDNPTDEDLTGWADFFPALDWDPDAVEAFLKLRNPAPAVSAYRRSINPE